jgi:hypothetical protein
VINALKSRRSSGRKTACKRGNTLQAGPKNKHPQATAAHQVFVPEPRRTMSRWSRQKSGSSRIGYPSMKNICHINVGPDWVRSYKIHALFDITQRLNLPVPSSRRSQSSWDLRRIAGCG